MAVDQLWSRDRALAIIQAHRATPGAALPMLHALQAEFGFVPADAVKLAAEALNITRAEMHGIVTFYHDFRHDAPGRHRLQICRAEACQAMGGAAMATALLERLGIAWGETTPDGALTIDPVYCLGLCACAPAALLDGQPMGRLTAEALAAAADTACAR